MSSELLGRLGVCGRTIVTLLLIGLTSLAVTACDTRSLDVSRLGDAPRFEISEELYTTDEMEEYLKSGKQGAVYFPQVKVDGVTVFDPKLGGKVHWRKFNSAGVTLDKLAKLAGVDSYEELVLNKDPDQFYKFNEQFDEQLKAQGWQDVATDGNGCDSEQEVGKPSLRTGLCLHGGYIVSKGNLGKYSCSLGSNGVSTGIERHPEQLTISCEGKESLQDDYLRFMTLSAQMTALPTADEVDTMLTRYEDLMLTREELKG